MPADRNPPDRSGDAFQIFSGHLAALPVGDKVELELLALEQIVEAGALDGADVDEGVGPTVVRGDESKALLRVEPFDGSRSHGNPFLHRILLARRTGRRNRISRREVRQATLKLARSHWGLTVYRLIAYGRSTGEAQGLVSACFMSGRRGFSHPLRLERQPPAPARSFECGATVGEFWIG